MAVCDVDKNRAAAGPAAVKNNYEKAARFNGGLKGDWEVKVYHDYKELLANKDIRCRSYKPARSSTCR